MSDVLLIFSGADRLADLASASGQFSEVFKTSALSGILELASTQADKIAAKRAANDFLLVVSDRTVEDLAERNISLSGFLSNLLSNNFPVVFCVTTPVGSSIVQSLPALPHVLGNVTFNKVAYAAQQAGIAMSALPDGDTDAFADPVVPSEPAVNPFAETPTPDTQPQPPAAEVSDPFTQSMPPQADNPFGDTPPDPQPSTVPSTNPFASQPDGPSPIAPPPASAPSANPFSDAATSDPQPAETSNPFVSQPAESAPAAPPPADPAPAGNPFGDTPESANPFSSAPPPEPADNPFVNTPPSEELGSNPFGDTSPAVSDTQTPPPGPPVFPESPVQTPSAANPFAGADNGAPSAANPFAVVNEQRAVQAVEPEPFTTEETGLSPISDSEVYNRKGYVIAVGAAKGGTGKSMIAASFAAYLGRRLADSGKRVCIVDTDVSGSDVAKQFSVFKPSVLDYVEHTHQETNIPATEVREKFMPFVSEYNLHLMLAPSDPRNTLADFVNGQLYVTLLDKLREEFDFVIVDTPVWESYHDIVRAVLSVADFSVVVVNQDAPTVQRVKAFLSAAQAPDQLNLDPKRVGVLLNRAIDSEIAFSTEDVASALSQYKFLGIIPQANIMQKHRNEGTLAVSGNYAELNSSFSNIAYVITGNEMFRTGEVSLEFEKKGVAALIEKLFKR